MSPQIKQLLRKVQPEYFSKGKSPKWRKLRSNYRNLKQKSVPAFFSRLVKEITDTDKHKSYMKMKQIGSIHPVGSGELKIECLDGKFDEECAEEVAKAFASVSNEFLPVDLCQLPAFLPCLSPPHVTQLQVYKTYTKNIQ